VFPKFVGYTDRIEKSLKYGTISEYDVNSPNSAGETALYLASFYGHEQVLLKLLELEHLQISKPHEESLSTPLHGKRSLAGYILILLASIEKGRERIVALLLANGASYEAKDK
jgi:ankyrin repeat protein